MFKQTLIWNFNNNKKYFLLDIIKLDFYSINYNFKFLLLY